MVFLRELPADLKKLASRREVVDGQQRLRTVLSFIEPAAIDDYDVDTDSFTVRRSHNKDLADKSFADLDDGYQQAILDYEISVYIFPASTSDQEILQIFARLNSTGLKLNYQELRNAQYFGEFKTLTYNLAAEQLERWRAWRVFSESDIARMLEVELMSEFIQTVMRGVSAKTKSSLDALYRDLDEEFPEAEIVAERCRRTLDTMDERLGRQLRALPSRRRTLVYGLFCAIYDLLYGLGSALNRQKPRPLPLSRARILGSRLQAIATDTAPEKVLEVTARRTTHRAERTALVNYLLKE